jgi:hypothetical protein
MNEQGLAKRLQKALDKVLGSAYANDDPGFISLLAHDLAKELLKHPLPNDGESLGVLAGDEKTLAHGERMARKIAENVERLILEGAKPLPPITEPPQHVSDTRCQLPKVSEEYAKGFREIVKKYPLSLQRYLASLTGIMVSVEPSVLCPNCNGTGGVCIEDGDGWGTCPVCDGKHYVPAEKSRALKAADEAERIGEKLVQMANQLPIDPPLPVNPSGFEFPPLKRLDNLSISKRTPSVVVATKLYQIEGNKERFDLDACNSKEVTHNGKVIGLTCNARIEGDYIVADVVPVLAEPETWRDKPPML